MSPSGERVTYALPGDVVLALAGGRAVRRHFRAEYGSPADIEGLVPGTDVRFGRWVDSDVAETLSGGHKTVRWSVALGPASGSPLRAWIRLAGRPLGFAISLVQGFFVEPLISVAAARAGAVLLPAAALVERDGALVVMGASRSGKTSLMIRAQAAGRAVLGDDQVVLDSSAHCRPFPRRARVYPDLGQTAPGAYDRLGAGVRSQLRARRWVARATRGSVAPALALDRSRLADRPAPAALPISRVVVLERDGDADEIRVRSLDSAEAAAAGVSLLDAQRSRLAAGPSWAEALAETRALESERLASAFAGLPAERVAVPAHWGAAAGVSAVARRLGIEG